MSIVRAWSCGINTHDGICANLHPPCLEFATDENESEGRESVSDESKRVQLGDLLLAERRRRGWSAERAAKHFEMNQSSFSRWEKGENAPDEKKFPQVAEFLGLTVEEVRALKYAMDAPVTASEVHLRQTFLDSRVEAIETRIDGIEARLAVMEQALMGLVRRIGTPEFLSEVSGNPDQN